MHVQHLKNTFRLQSTFFARDTFGMRSRKCIKRETANKLDQAKCQRRSEIKTNFKVQRANGHYAYPNLGTEAIFIHLFSLLHSRATQKLRKREQLWQMRKQPRLLEPRCERRAPALFALFARRLAGDLQPPLFDSLENTGLIELPCGCY